MCAAQLVAWVDQFDGHWAHALARLEKLFKLRGHMTRQLFQDILYHKARVHEHFHQWAEAEATVKVLRATVVDDEEEERHELILRQISLAELAEDKPLFDRLMREEMELHPSKRACRFPSESPSV